MRRLTTVDLKALREQVCLTEGGDAHSPNFLRFVIHLSEVLNEDIPAKDYPYLETLSGCIAYLEARPAAAG